MKHLPPDIRSARHTRSACRKGRHLFGEPQNIGGGILRQVCETCGEVSIDLTDADDSTSEVSRETRRTRSRPAAEGWV